MGGISLITICDRKFRHNRPEEGLPKMITYISPINMVAEDSHLYFAYKSPLGTKCTKYSFPFSFSFSIENEKKKRTPPSLLPPLCPPFLGGSSAASPIKIWDVIHT